MSTKRLLSIATILGILAIGLAQLDSHANNPSRPRLQELRSFEVLQFEPIFDQTPRIDYPELSQQLSELLRTQKLLPSASPADGVIRASCRGYECKTVRLTVSQGQSGPEVWHTDTQTYKFWPWFQRPSRQVASDLMSQLSQHYHGAPSAQVSSTAP